MSVTKGVSWSFLIRLLITLAGVGYLLGFKEWGDIFSAVKTAKVSWLIAAFLAYGITTALGMVRWKLLLDCCNSPVSWKRTAELTMVGIFANSFMPGAMGGDLFKAVLATRYVPTGKTKIVMSILMERVLGFIAMFLVSTGLIINRFVPLTTEPATRLAVYLYFIAFLIVLLIVFLGAWKKVGQFIPFWNRLPFRKSLAEAGSAYQTFMHHQPTFWGGLGLSILAHFSLLLTCWFVSQALGLDLSFWDLGAVLPLIALVTLVLPSFGGLGVRELAFQHFLTFAAINKETSIALSLIFYGVTLLWSILGGLVYLQYRGTVSTIPEAEVEDAAKEV
ncbi:MAG: lysylphosphatidylglycerol synthase transmembrane domain-containing protein [Verrucomicrobiota bacterium]